jgi:hypothetical protein
MVFVGAPPEIRFQHRSLCLLYLEEQRIISVAALEQHDVVPGADTTYPYDLSRHVHETVLVEQVTTVVLQGTPVHLQDVVDLSPQPFLYDTNQERWIIDEDDPLFLQVKEAEASVLESYLRKSAYKNHGQRVVAGQRLMQAASDIFLGWLRGPGGRDFYWRQLKQSIGPVWQSTEERSSEHAA